MPEEVIKAGKHYWGNNSDVDVYGRDLRPAGLGMLTYFRRRADRHGKSYPSIERICSDLNIRHFNTAMKYIRLLENLHLLKVEKRGGKYIFHILSSRNSFIESRTTQKVNTKENPVKDYSKGESISQRVVDAMRDKNPIEAKKYAKKYGLRWQD